jgi:transcriptional regulator with XRE-family HTH domain
MTSHAQTPGSRVCALRKRFGLSQERLASLAGLDRVQVVKLERRQRIHSYRLRAGLADAFGLTLQQLDAYLGGDDSAAEAAALAEDLPATGTGGN